MRKLLIGCVLLIFVSVACDKEQNDRVEPPEQTELYFPPTGSDAWETMLPEDFGWNTAALDDLYSTLESNGTRAFIVLQDGRIVLEKYWGDNFFGGEFTRNSHWYWASAGKTIISFLVGIAQQEGHLNITDRTSDYLGRGWASMEAAKEDLITIRHQLTMTTGLDYTIDDPDCLDPACLKYKADAGQQWFYHNAPYTLLKDVLTAATGVDYNLYCDQRLEALTGMSGEWNFNGSNNVYWSTPRDMARFGLLILNKGKWDETEILSDPDYFMEMTSSSQNLNPAYGYLWWLNGKQKIVYPGLPIAIKGQLSPDAPADLVVGAGKNGQFVDVIPSLNMVVVRMGEAPGDVAVPIEFHNEMWKKLNPVIGR